MSDMAAAAVLEAARVPRHLATCWTESAARKDQNSLSLQAEFRITIPSGRGASLPERGNKCDQTLPKHAHFV